MGEDTSQSTRNSSSSSGPGVRRRKPAVDARIERQILTGMIVSDRFLGEIRPLCTPDVFQAEMARRVAGWCLDHYQKYQKAPGRHIEDIFLKHKEGVGEQRIADDEAALIEEFLRSIRPMFSAFMPSRLMSTSSST